MADERADRRMRAYAALEGLRQTLPNVDPKGQMQGHVTEQSIGQFEQALDDLEACGENVRQYRLGPGRDGRALRLILATELHARVLAVLGYFTIRDAVLEQASQTGEALQTLIGFETPQR